MGALSELRGMGIEMKGVIAKGGCQRGDGRMERLLMMWREQKVQSLDPWRVMSGTPSPTESEESVETKSVY